MKHLFKIVIYTYFSVTVVVLLYLIGVKIDLSSSYDIKIINIIDKEVKKTPKYEGGLSFLALQKLPNNLKNISISIQYYKKINNNENELFIINVDELKLQDQNLFYNGYTQKLPNKIENKNFQDLLNPTIVFKEKKSLFNIFYNKIINSFSN